MFKSDLDFNQFQPVLSEARGGKELEERGGE